MAGSGVAVRLHEFRALQDPRQVHEQTTLTPKPSRLGKDVRGIYPGQLGRVHFIHSKDCGYNPHSGRSHHKSLPSPNPAREDYQQSFDIRTLRALNALRHSPAVLEQCPHQTAYQAHFGHTFTQANTKPPYLNL